MQRSSKVARGREVSNRVELGEGDCMILLFNDLIVIKSHARKEDVSVGKVRLELEGSDAEV